MYNIAVVGCGYWGPNLIRNFNSLPEAKLAMVCDLDEKRLAYIKRLYPDVTAVKDDEEIYRNAEIDAVVIATPVQFHYKMASKSLAAGKHTFIEKPICNSVENGKKLLGLARKQQKVLMVGHTFIYSPPVRRIKEIIDSGELGDIQYISSRRLNLGLFQNDINVAWDLAPHDISIILFTLGYDPISVNCQGKAHINPDIEDVTNMTLNFDNDCFATIQSSWLDPNKVREMTFVGSKKMLVYDDLEPIEKIKIYDKRVEVPPHYDTFAEFHYSYHYGDMYAPYIKQYEPMAAECQHFIDCIKTGMEPESGGQEALKVVQILEASSQSLKNDGGIVPINHIVD